MKKEAKNFGIKSGTLRRAGLVAVLFAVITSGIMASTADTTKWRQLFNGKDLTGWKHVGPGDRYVEDGLCKSHGGMGLLYWTGEKFGNCKIRVVYRMRDENSNSGVFIRIPIEPREEWMPVHYGYEVQIDNKSLHRYPLFADKTPFKTWQTRPGMEHYGDYSRRSQDHCLSQWRTCN
jgi:Domain of Unknown Function (DUF1080)